MGRPQAGDLGYYLSAQTETECHAKRLLQIMEGKLREPRSRGTPNTESRDYTDEESEFIAAMRKFIETTGRKFPSFTEHLLVLKSLGYKKGD